MVVWFSDPSGYFYFELEPKKHIVSGYHFRDAAYGTKRQEKGKFFLITQVPVLSHFPEFACRTTISNIFGFRPAGSNVNQPATLNNSQAGNNATYRIFITIKKPFTLLFLLVIEVGEKYVFLIILIVKSYVGGINE